MASFGVRTQFATRAHVLRTPMPKRISVHTSVLRRRAVVMMAAKIDKAEVFERTKTVIMNQLDVEKVEYNTTFTDMTKDSLDIVEVMMALEEEFEIQLNDEDSAKITNVEEAVDLIRATVEGKGSVGST